MSKLSILSELWDFLKSKKKMVAWHQSYFTSSAWWINYFDSRFCFSTIYLCNILIRLISESRRQEVWLVDNARI